MTSKISILMKKEAVLFLFIAVLLISGCTKSDSNFIEIEENIQVENIEAPVIEEIIEETTTTLPVKEEIQLIYPVLTYEGAYNGPLYGTSEQVGSASMDSYFENLDRNGINFFIGMFGISGEPSINTLTSDQGLGEVIDAAKKHPKRIQKFDGVTFDFENWWFNVRKSNNEPLLRINLEAESEDTMNKELKNLLTLIKKLNSMKVIKNV